MLVLTRKIGEKLHIGEAVVTITEVRGRHVRLKIDAPRQIRVLRGELIDREEKKEVREPAA